MRDPNSQDPQSINQIKKHIQSRPLTQGQMLIELKPDSDGWWVEMNRGFIMPHDWPNRALLRDK